MIASMGGLSRNGSVAPRIMVSDTNTSARPVTMRPVCFTVRLRPLKNSPIPTSNSSGISFSTGTE